VASAESADDLRQAEICLGELGRREDLPEARILAEVLALRLGQPDGVGGLSHDYLGRLERDLPDCAQKWLLLAEGYYRFARRMGGLATGSWYTCRELAGRCLECLCGLPGYRPERRDALLMRGLACLVLGLDLETSAAHAAVSSRWRDALRFAASYLRTPWVRPLRRDVPCLEEEAPTILREEETALLRLVCTQAAGGAAAARSLLSRLDGWGRDQFFAIRLLRARQARLDGRDADARLEYDCLLEEATAHGPNFLLDVVAEERGTTAR
jgi:hypothetical protein